MKFLSNSFGLGFALLSPFICSIHANPSLQHPVVPADFDATKSLLRQAGLPSAVMRECVGHCQKPGNLPKRCCSCWVPCDCPEDDICSRFATFAAINSTDSPDSDPETVFFSSVGLTPGAPCCGPKCSPQQCLNMTKLELNVLEDPLKGQLEALNVGTSPEPEDCCGPGCEVAGCFRTLLSTVIKMQKPIENTQNNFFG